MQIRAGDVPDMWAGAAGLTSVWPQRSTTIKVRRVSARVANAVQHCNAQRTVAGVQTEPNMYRHTMTVA
eukprot:11225599-Lingulodinium_polyedra.AAC.1